jgi:hypothetical protein
VVHHRSDRAAGRRRQPVNAAYAEHRTEVGGGDAHQHLPDAEARRDPSALVESGREASPQVGEPEGRHPAPERPPRRADQDADEADASSSASRFLYYTGVFMLHCPMMNHEEMGMMQTVEVYDN